MADFLLAVWGIIVDRFWDNALTTVPIIISIVAVIISITTTRKQNKIALFELRYRCYSQLRTIRSFDSSIHDCKEPDLVLKMFDALWGTNIADASGDESLILARCHMEKVIHDVLQQEFLFGCRFETNFSDILICTQRILLAATSGENDIESQNQLHRLCEKIERKDINIMRRKLKI